MKRFILNIIKVKLGYILFSFLGVMLLFASCHNEPIVLNPLTTLNIELQKKSVTGGTANKNEIIEFGAIVSVAYDNDTIDYNCRFVASDSTFDLYMFDYMHSDIVYAALHTPFRILVDATISDRTMHGESDIIVIENDPATITIVLGTNYHEQLPYVDLGLPSGLLWATCNLGATSPEGYGNYYAWAETTPKQVYTWSTYKYYDTDITKYTIGDGISYLDLEDDAASVNLGAGWKIPTNDDFDELQSNCTMTWTSRNGINGCLFVGPNGNSIFFPMSGGKKRDNLLNYGSCGFYWLNSVYSDENYAYGFLLDSTTATETSYYRMYGQTIRPVYDVRK